METKTLSKPALEILEKYLHFRVGSASCAVPYFNNKTVKTRAALRTYVGKGSPDDIKEELESIVIKSKIDTRALTDETLKKLLIDNGLGVECSGFCYHILDTESHARNFGTISKRITFINCSGFVGQIRCSIRPAENCDVETFADNTNSRTIPIRDISPGDIITMRPTQNSKERDHILLVRQVEYENSIPTKIFYSHSVAYPEDGVYGTGVRNGYIEIVNPDLPITEATWKEENKKDSQNLLFIRANRSKTEIRRLKWF
jgi:hypothetical protein